MKKKESDGKLNGKIGSASKLSNNNLLFSRDIEIFSPKKVNKNTIFEESFNDKKINNFSMTLGSVIIEKSNMNRYQINNSFNQKIMHNSVITNSRNLADIIGNEKFDKKEEIFPTNNNELISEFKLNSENKSQNDSKSDGYKNSSLDSESEENSNSNSNSLNRPYRTRKYFSENLNCLTKKIKISNPNVVKKSKFSTNIQKELNKVNESKENDSEKTNSNDESKKKEVNLIVEDENTFSMFDSADSMESESE